jgi:hypothetical protein
MSRSDRPELRTRTADRRKSTGPQRPRPRQRQQQLTREDHADMMAQLGIKTLRPGKNGTTANYDPATA